MKAKIVADRSMSGPGCNWLTYIPIANGPWSHKEGPSFNTVEKAREYLTSKGYEFEEAW